MASDNRFRRRSLRSVVLFRFGVVRGAEVACGQCGARDPSGVSREETVAEIQPLNLAYIDPGSGTLLIQLLLASFVGGIVFFRNQVVGLASWIKHKAFANKS